MAITDAQKVDLLYKKIGFGVAKTDTSAFKSPSNEANASPLLTRGDTIWVESSLIPATKPASNSSVMLLYQDTLSSTIQATLDSTVSGTNRTWLTNLTDWIPAEFGSDYQVKIYADTNGSTTPQTTGTQLFADGSGNSDSWYFDYQAGILNFADTNVPTAVSGKRIFVVGARYRGLKGIGTLANLDIGNLNVNSMSINNASILGGYLTNIANITALTSNIGSLYSAILNITSANVQTGWLGNLSTGNAVISGGYISSLSNITVTTGNTESWYTTSLNSTSGNITTLASNNFSTANALVAGGVIYNVDIQANNFSTANALITSGVLNNVNIQANNFSAANALITSGNVAANISGNITGTFGNFSGNVNADWFVGNIDASIANFSDVTISGNLTALGNILAQKITSSVGDLHISAATDDPNNIIRFDSVSALDIASGTTNQRPPTPDYGYLRYNIDYGSIEWWTGASWVQGIQNISSELISPDGVSDTFTLSQIANENSILVNINGTIQQAGSSAYSVAGNQITFAEIPLTTDLIEIRFIAGGVAVTGYGNTQVGTYLTNYTGNISAGNLTIAGNVIQQSAYYETFGNISNTGGNLTCNFNTGAVFYVNSLTANVTANFTNVNAVSGTVTGATVIINQGATAYQISNVQVNGTMQTVRWAGATIPVGTASNTDIMSFSLINLGAGGWRVLGQISNYG